VVWGVDLPQAFHGVENCISIKVYSALSGRTGTGTFAFGRLGREILSGVDEAIRLERAYSLS